MSNTSLPDSHRRRRTRETLDLKRETWRPKTIRLFDLNNDPEEMNNLAEDTTYQDTVRQLFSDLVELQRHMDDTLDLSEVFNKMK